MNLQEWEKSYQKAEEDLKEAEECISILGVDETPKELWDDTMLYFAKLRVSAQYRIQRLKLERKGNFYTSIRLQEVYHKQMERLDSLARAGGE